MPPVGRVCSECPNSLAGKPVHTKTCTESCRVKRSRRIRRARREEEQLLANDTHAAQEIRAIVRREAPDEITKVMHEELRPVVREAIGDDVLRAIQDMLGLTPRAVELLKEDMESEDSTVRQRAYTLALKYTVGHPSLLKSSDGEDKDLNVILTLPRPDEDALAAPPDPEPELLECDMCHETKLADEFVAGSTRCRRCFDDWRENVMERFA